VNDASIRILGITGGIGAGKSRLARLLEELFDAPVIDADQLGHSALEPGSSVYEAVLARFGDDLVGERGEIVRSKLAAIVFNEEGALTDLERIVHPWILDRVQARVAALKASGYVGIIVFDAALLLDWLPLFRPDGIAVVVARREFRLARLAGRGMSSNEAERRMDHQRADETWGSAADWVIENSGSLEDLERSARRLWQDAKKRWGWERSEGEERTDG